MKMLLIAPLGFATIKSENVQSVHGGYGNASFGMYYTLAKLKEEGLIADLDVIDTSQKKLDIPDKEYDVAILNYPPASYVGDKRNVFTIKNILQKCKKKYYHLVWETEPLPKRFKAIFEDDFFDGYLAPSHWGAEVIKKETKRSVHYFPHLLIEDNWNLIDINKKVNEKLFTVLFIGQNTLRKGIQDAIISFARTLGDKQDCQLFMKLSMMSRFEFPLQEYLHSLVSLNQMNSKARINYIDTNLSDEELGDIYEMSSLFFFPTRGEGFGLPAAEAMLQGLPVIYTNFSACPDVCESPVNTKIGATIDEAYSMAPYGYENGCKYGIPEMSGLMGALLTYYDLWKEDKKAYYEKMQVNRQIIIDRFSYSKVKEYYKKVLTD